MIKTKKGQVIIIDVLFAVVILILMFFLLLKIAEIEMYNTNADKYTEKLNYTGSLAYQKLLNNPQLNCKVVDSQNSFYLPGTLNIAATTAITKAKLGIPSDFNCNLAVTGVAFTTNECTQTPTLAKNTYSVDFNVVTCNGNITKSDYIKYITNTTNPTIAIAKLKVWRNN